MNFPRTANSSAVLNCFDSNTAGPVSETFRRLEEVLLIGSLGVLRLAAEESDVKRAVKRAVGLALPHSCLTCTISTQFLTFDQYRKSSPRHKKGLSFVPAAFAVAYWAYLFNQEMSSAACTAWIRTNNPDMHQSFWMHWFPTSLTLGINLVLYDL